MTRYVLIILCLAAVTVVVAESDARFERVGEVFPESLRAIGGDWQHSRGGVSRTGFAPPELQLLAQGIPKISYVAKIIPHPRTHEYLRVSAEIRTDELKGEVAPWNSGRLLLISFDEHGQRLWYWPAIVAELEGTNPWRHYAEVIPVHDGIDAMEVVAYAAAQSGSLRLRGLRVDSMKETALFTGLRLSLVCAWALAGLWLLYVLSGRRLRSWSRLIAVAVAMMIIAAGMAPQPHFNAALKALLFGTQDLVFAGRELLQQIGGAPERGAGFDHAAQSATLDVGPAAAARERIRQAERGPRAFHDAYAPSESHAGAGRMRLRYWVPDWQDLDKKEHLIAFSVLGLLAGFAYRPYSSVRVALSLAVLAGSIQAMQSLSITRETDVGDLQYDLVGIGIGLGMAYILDSVRRILPAPRGSTD